MTRDFTPAPPTASEIEHICRDVLSCSPTTTTMLRAGAWSSAVGLDTERGPMVIRFSATDVDFRTDALASKFAGPDLPIPHVYRIGQLGNRWWCVSQRMPGIHLDELDADGMIRVLPSLAAALIAIRNASPAGTQGYGGWVASGNGRFATFAEQLLEISVDHPGERGGGWSERLRPHVHAQSVFEAGLTTLQELAVFVPEVRQLIHQDTINFNVTVEEDRISGIFDWGCAMWGDALYDLAWFRFWNPWYPQWAEVNLPDRLESVVGLHGPNTQQRMQCYLLHIGLGHIRYNAFTENWSAMDEVVRATETMLRDRQI